MTSPTAESPLPAPVLCTVGVASPGGRAPGGPLHPPGEGLSDSEPVSCYEAGLVFALVVLAVTALYLAPVVVGLIPYLFDLTALALTGTALVLAVLEVLFLAALTATDFDSDLDSDLDPDLDPEAHQPHVPLAMVAAA